MNSIIDQQIQDRDLGICFILTSEHPRIILGTNITFIHTAYKPELLATEFKTNYSVNKGQELILEGIRFRVDKVKSGTVIASKIN